ncbi:CBS domain-containing protein [Kitasatospora sp. NPDC091276]|uniref:CBS domain-containing protein n=1 Tax=Kitasatospora sp. NPDC091276 TaxID=3155300 RepID=UPI00341B2C56
MLTDDARTATQQLMHTTSGRTVAVSRFIPEVLPDTGRVVLDTVRKPYDTGEVWISLTPAEARELAGMLLRQAAAVERHGLVERSRKGPRVMKAAELMTAPPATVGLAATVFEAARRMEQQAVGCVLVTDDGRLRGILTDRDLTVRGLAHGHDPGQPVADLMTTPVTTVDADDDLDTAYRTFRTSGVRRLPVLDDGRPVGVLTVDDLLRDVVERLVDLLIPVSHSTLRENATWSPVGRAGSPTTEVPRPLSAGGHDGR